MSLQTTDEIPLPLLNDMGKDLTITTPCQRRLALARPVGWVLLPTA